MTLKLLGLAERHWSTIEGWWTTQRSKDLWDLPPYKMLSVIYYWATQGADEQSLAKFDRQLWVPPPGYDKPITEGPWTAEAETSAFKAFATDVGIKPK